MIIRAVYTHNVHFSGAGCQHAAQTSPSTLRRVSEPLMIVRMTTASRPQRRYDHRLRNLVQRTRDVTIATDLGVPRSTARGWLDAAPRVVIGLEVADLTELELRQEILKLRRRVEKLAALLRLALALLHASGFSLSCERLPEEDAKRRILRAVDRARECLPLRAVLRFMGLSPSRFQAWRRRQTECTLDDQSSCPRTSPHRLRPCEVQAIGAMVSSPEYRHLVGVTLVRAAVAEWRRQRREVFVPLTYRPGDLAAVDFFEVWVDLAGRRRKAWLFLMRLMYSGRDFAWIYERQDQVSFLDGHSPKRWCPFHIHDDLLAVGLCVKQPAGQLARQKVDEKFKGVSPEGARSWDFLAAGGMFP